MSHLCKHIRRPYPQPMGELWLMRCDCGWSGSIVALGQSARVAYDELNRQFLAHIPPAELRAYVLVDVRVEREADPEAGIPERLYGIFIMPEGVGCRVIRDWEDDGVRWAEVQEWDPLKPPVSLPIGEIRTREGKVWRCG